MIMMMARITSDCAHCAAMIMMMARITSDCAHCAAAIGVGLLLQREQCKRRRRRLLESGRQC